MIEPTYEYVKGEGWVATVNNKWCVIYKYEPGDEWHNAIAYKVHLKFQEAEREYNKMLIDFARFISCDAWEFKLVPWTEDCGY